MMVKVAFALAVHLKFKVTLKVAGVTSVGSMVPKLTLPGWLGLYVHDWPSTGNAAPSAIAKTTARSAIEQVYVTRHAVLMTGLPREKKPRGQRREASAVPTSLSYGATVSVTVSL